MCLDVSPVQGCPGYTFGYTPTDQTSSARLAALYPESGGTYVYGHERLGPFWGYLAGWGFVVGKTAAGRRWL